MKKILHSVIFLLPLLWAPAVSQASPRLVIVIVVDQMRGDYANLYRSKFRHGFKRLFTEGAIFTDAHQPHVPTETAPGHAAIATGQPPAVNGIIGNQWLDRASQQMVRSITDSEFRVSPRQLRVPTWSDRLKKADRQSRVVGVSAKDRSAVLLGGLEADVAVWFDRSKAFVTSGYYKHVPTALASLNERMRPAINAAQANPNAQYDQFINSPAIDEWTWQAAEALWDEYQLGADEHTDVLAISFSGPDHVGHRFGPETPEVERQLLVVDALLGKILERAARFPDTIVVLTSDHGVNRPYNSKGEALMRGKMPRVREVEKLLQAHSPREGQSWVVNIAFPNIYLNPKLLPTAARERHTLLTHFAGLLKNLPDLVEVFIPPAMEPQDYLTPYYKNGYFAGRSGDLLFAMLEETIYAGGTELGTHGSPYEYDTWVPLVFWGKAFKPGWYPQPATVLDIAPTLSHVLKLPPPTPPDAGAVLTDALK